jgi:hypothetical protein
MRGTNEAIYNLLVADTTLVNMLASNKPYYNTSGVSSKSNSIIPADVADRKLNVPIVIIQEGNELSIGTNLVSETIYIRCYNDVDKSYFDINRVLDRVRTLLHDAQLNISDKVAVRVEWEATLGGLVDESLNLKFKESRFRVLVL